MNRKECLSSCRLYGIVDMGYTAEHQLLPVTEKLLAGGLRILQLRAKNHNPEHIENMGRQLAPLCRKYGCLFIINDYPEIALNIGADGVHLGQDDGDLASVRGLLGKDAVIGRSTHSPEQALGACGEQADYIGFGPLFPTGTKPGRQAIGLEDIASVQQQLPENFPVFCIGGINGNTLPSVLEAGANRVVIVSWLLTHPDITGTVRTLRKERAPPSMLSLPFLFLRRQSRTGDQKNGGIHNHLQNVLLILHPRFLFLKIHARDIFPQRSMEDGAHDMRMPR